MDNIKLMTATEAFNETTYRNEANKILKIASTSICAACGTGHYEIVIDVDARIEKGAVDLALADLRNKGYKVTFHLDNSSYEHYWDKIEISWKGDN